MSSVTKLKEAVTQLKHGQFKSAALLSKQSAVIAPDAINGWLVYGLALSYSGKAETSEFPFRRAFHIDPVHKDAVSNLATTLTTQGKWQDARNIVTEAFRGKPDLQFLEILLDIQNRSKDLDLIWTTAISLAVLFPQNLNAAAAIAKTASERDVNKSANLVARLFVLSPDNPTTLEAYGNEVVDKGTTQDVELAIQRGNSLAQAHPFDHRVNLVRARLFNQIGKPESQRRILWQTMLANPAEISSLIALIKYAERSSDLTLAEKLLKISGFVSIDNEQILYLSAILAERLDKFDEAIELSREVLKRKQNSGPDHIQITAANTLALALDKIDACDEAYKAFTLSNDLHAQNYGNLLERGRRHKDNLQELADTLLNSDTASWSRLTEPRESPVFLVGFPRSGTTLLDQIIDSHDKASVLEEVTTFENLVQDLEQSPQRFVDEFSTLTDDQAEIYRQQYTAILEQHLPHQEGSVRIDKMPLRTIHAWAITRLYPDARFIVALRHPADCVLSSFMQHFRLNIASVNFLNIRQSFEYYEAVMSLWRVTREKFQPNFIEVRYEDVVADTEHERRRVYDFLGLSTDGDIAAHHEHALKRRRIITPSFRQVVRPIYGKSVGRWSRYSDDLAPYLDIIRPSAEDFGYEI